MGRARDYLSLVKFSHSIFEQADEYDGPTFYFEAANEPNIFSTEDNCPAVSPGGVGAAES